MWRIVTAKIATLTEIEEHWNIDDILDANAVLDFQHASQQLANESK